MIFPIAVIGKNHEPAPFRISSLLRQNDLIEENFIFLL